MARTPEPSCFLLSRRSKSQHNAGESQSRRVNQQLKILICKFVAPNAFATGAVALFEIATLRHEVGNNLIRRGKEVKTQVLSRPSPNLPNQPDGKWIGDIQNPSHECIAPCETGNRVLPLKNSVSAIFSSHLKFSDVLGHTSGRNCKMSRPAGVPPILMSM